MKIRERELDATVKAIEEGKNIIRSSNNGISAFINPKGEVIKKIESTQKGVIVINSLSYAETTIFSKHGNKIFFYFLIFWTGMPFYDSDVLSCGSCFV